MVLCMVNRYLKSPPLLPSLPISCAVLHAAGRYEYMATLQQLDGCQPRAQPRLPPGCGHVITPLRWRQWAQALAQHPDRQFVSYVVEGIRSGFRVGSNYAQVQYSPAKRNMPSAEEHANIVTDYLKAEVTQGRVCGPFVPASWPQVQISRFGVIPKSTPGKWRLILDLSSPEGRSVNDGIDGAHCSLSYVSVDDAAQLVRNQGKGALMAKVDIQSAYRTIPVHPGDRVLLGMISSSSILPSLLAYALPPKFLRRWQMQQHGQLSGKYRHP